MTTADFFSLANMMAMAMWILMIFLPRWKATTFLTNHKLIPMLLSISYVFYIAKSMSQGGGMDFGSLESVMNLFTKEHAVMAGWIHYLAFDLLIGMWMIEQNKKLGIHSILMGICLLCTFMLGPVGFLIFQVCKMFFKKSNL